MSIYSVLLMVIMNLDISNAKFKTIVHAVAMNENRYQFSRRSIYTSEKDAKNKNDVVQSDGKYRLEKGFFGCSFGYWGWVCQWGFIQCKPNVDDKTG